MLLQRKRCSINFFKPLIHHLVTYIYLKIVNRTIYQSYI
jgi:hypothetical protein